jgi:hypothetical protein
MNGPISRHFFSQPAGHPPSASLALLGRDLAGCYVVTSTAQPRGLCDSLGERQDPDQAGAETCRLVNAVLRGPARRTDGRRCIPRSARPILTRSFSLIEALSNQVAASCIDSKG